MENKISLEIGKLSRNTPQPNNAKLTIGKLKLYFSYETIIGFDDGDTFFACVNEWGITTGTHLNYICPNKKERIPHNQMMEKLNKILKGYGLVV